MKRIRILDKQFDPYLSEQEIQKSIKSVAERINQDYQGKDPLFLCILNGAFMFGADLFKELDLLCQVSFVKMSSYKGTSSGSMKYLIGLNEKENFQNRDIIIVEDIVDTGNTLMSILPQIEDKRPNSVEVATLLYKPDAYQMSYPIKYHGLTIPNDFVVGYGLDYNGYGRNLREIYKVVEL